MRDARPAAMLEYFDAPSIAPAGARRSIPDIPVEAADRDPCSSRNWASDPRTAELDRWIDRVESSGRNGEASWFATTPAESGALSASSAHDLPGAG